MTFTLLTKDETSETILRNLFIYLFINIYLFRFLTFRFPCIGQNWLISVLSHLVNHQNTQLNAETKNQ